jgi:hypothetical protein
MEQRWRAPRRKGDAIEAILQQLRPLGGEREAWNWEETDYLMEEG